MVRNDSLEYLVGLLHELRQLPKETEWVEFKCNNANPEEIGEYISALANSAARPMLMLFGGWLTRRTMSSVRRFALRRRRKVMKSLKTG